jgi:hypothetical protein
VKLTAGGRNNRPRDDELMPVIGLLETGIGLPARPVPTGAEMLRLDRTAQQILAITKIVCDRIHPLTPFGHFMEA